MGFWSLFLVASMPVVQVLLIGMLGAYLASGYSNILTASARKDMNKVVFVVFTPSLMFASLAKTVTLQEIISWWYMPVNIGITFLIGGFLGWIAVKILKPERHLEGLIIATCSAGNLGNLLLIIVPAICNEDGNPFGDHRVCSIDSLAYVSFSMALGGFFIWTHTYSLMRNAGKIYHKIHTMGNGVSEIQDKDQNIVPLLSHGDLSDYRLPFWEKLKGTLHKIVEELFAPPTVGAILGFVVGAISWLKSLLIGETAPLRVIQDSFHLLGDGTIPCITLILGGNLTKAGLRKSVVKPTVIIAIICVRYVMLPIAGMAVVKAAYELGFLSHDPLYRYVLMIQFAIPPAMNIGTMAQLFDVAQEECSVIFLWTYLAAALSLTVWSTIFMWILS